MGLVPAFMEHSATEIIHFAFNVGNQNSCFICFQFCKFIYFLLENSFLTFRISLISAGQRTLQDSLIEQDQHGSFKFILV